MLIKNYKQFVKLLNLYYKQTQVLFSHLIKYCLRHHHHQHHPQPQQLQLKHLHFSPTSTSHSFMSLYDVTSLLLLLLLVLPQSCVVAVGYSYTRFVGPVAGPEHKIYVNDADTSIDVKTPPHHVNVLPRLDYVAKPEYEFSYGVEDADAHILHNRNEMRDGDIVKGVYSLIDPDGALRVVKYTADEINGFQAEVIRNGVSSLHGQLQNDYKRLPPAKIINNNYYKPDHEQHYYPPTPIPAHTQTPEKLETNEYYSSSNGYAPNWEQLEKINQQLTYNPSIQYQPPPQPPIIYHYNNNEALDDGSSSSSSDSSDSDYHDNPQTHYEVHEKPNHDERDNEREEEDDDDDDGNDHKIKSQIVSHKKKKHPHHNDEYDDEDDNGENDEEDDNDSGDENDSEEFEDYNETEHNAKNSRESNEYY